MTDQPKIEPGDGRYAFFQHRACEYFPCHAADPADFNCLFCYCPLYALGEACGGAYAYTAEGIKDCSACLAPHGRDSVAYIAARFPELQRLAARKDEGDADRSYE